jgi:putative sterol carrier protein
MVNGSAEFFNDLSQRGHEASLEKVTGTLRFDLVHGKQTDRYYVAVTKGDIAVSDDDITADCVVRAERALFDSVVNGDTNPMAATLRGALTVEGDVQLLLRFERIFAGPSNSGDLGYADNGGRRS